jgi:hypothetical protein
MDYDLLSVFGVGRKSFKFKQFKLNFLEHVDEVI